MRYLAMIWPGSIIALILLCWLGGMWVKLQRLSRLETRLRGRIVSQQLTVTRRPAPRRR
ncbi:hypothetical protein BN439_0034 [Erwinia amylovora Ea644]|nr:hypothetical protein BN439_0034 [Erwinia amylovora Ea644]CCP05114.1 hypothetical protein BN440_0048 [Erwinia amylovora MR1]